MARFTGFSPDLFAFLKRLKACNEKAWFDAHREDFESHVKAPLGDLVETLSEAFAKDKVPLKGDAKKSLFRIFRDVRFSKDKSPYKTNAGAMLTASGDKKEPGMFYMHFEPAESFIAMGYYMPEPDVLDKLRRGVADDAKGFQKVLAGLGKKGLTLAKEYTVKRTPKGFEDVEDPATLEMVKLTSYVVSKKLANEEVLDAGLVASLRKFAKDALPLLQFGEKALKS